MRTAETGDAGSALEQIKAKVEELRRWKVEATEKGHAAELAAGEASRAETRAQNCRRELTFLLLREDMIDFNTQGVQDRAKQAMGRSADVTG